MQAQPVFNLRNLFSGKRKYRIKVAKYVRESDHFPVSELPHSVLEGWFAHELGHLIDYEPRSNFEMIIYGLRYVFSEKFRRNVEHDADSIAIANGFAPQIIAMKKYILENEMVSNDYKLVIDRYYMSIEDVEIFMEKNHVPVAPKIEI